MTSISDIIRSLPKVDQERLAYAFNHGFTQHVELPNDHFVGVNTTSTPNLKAKEVVGKWSYGVIIKEKA